MVSAAAVAATTAASAAAAAFSLFVVFYLFPDHCCHGGCDQCCYYKVCHRILLFDAAYCGAWPSMLTGLICHRCCCSMFFFIILWFLLCVNILIMVFIFLFYVKLDISFIYLRTIYTYAFWWIFFPFHSYNFLNKKKFPKSNNTKI